MASIIQPRLVAHPQEPKTWVRFRKELCEECWAGCCTMPLEVSLCDLIQLGLATEDDAHLPLEVLAKKLLREKLIETFQRKSQLFVLAQVSGRDCIYLTPQRKCSVYEKRPAVCRSFPKIGPKPGFCPYNKIEQRMR